MVILPARGSATTPEVNAVREVDLAGNPIRETNARVLNEQLAALGGPAVTDFRHEVRRLPTGDYLLMAARDMPVTNAGQCGTTNGLPRTCDVIGDLILILDPNLQLKWFWDAFSSLTCNALGRTSTGAPRSEKPIRKQAPAVRLLRPAIPQPAEHSTSRTTGCMPTPSNTQTTVTSSSQ